MAGPSRQICHIGPGGGRTRNNFLTEVQTPVRLRVKLPAKGRGLYLPEKNKNKGLTLPRCEGLHWEHHRKEAAAMKEFTVYPIGSIEGEEGAQFIQLAPGYSPCPGGAGGVWAH